MALLFQSNPDQWNLRKYLKPGGHVRWFVSRYQTLMRPGALVLLWVAKGSQSPQIKGLYGWGVTTDEVKQDDEGRLRIRLQYVERWVSKTDDEKKVDDENHIAPIPADKVLDLPAWKDHLLAVMPAGTNFLVTAEQLQELTDNIVDAKFQGSQFRRAVNQDIEGGKLDPNGFTFKRLVAKE